MGDNFTLKNDDSTTVGTLAADEVTYSGDTSVIPLSRIVHVSGAEGSKTASEVFAAAGSASANVLSVQGVASMTALTVDGSGVTQPVSGTVTANLSATDNAVLDSIAASLAGTLTVGSHEVTNAGTFAVQAAQSGTWNINNISGTVSLPTGAATAAKQPALGTAGTASSDVITVQGIASMTALVVDGSGVTQPVSGTVTANLSAIDNAVLDSMDAHLDAIETTLDGGITVSNLGLTELAAAINANRLDVNIAADGVGIGGGTQYSVDDAAGGTDTGTVSLAVRDDSLTTLTPADGDYVPLRVSSTGALHVTGGGGGTEYTEDVATPNPIVGTATLIERDDALTTVTPVEGDWIGLRGTAEGALWVQDFNSDAILADTAAMVVDLAAIEALLGTIDTDTGSIATSASTIAGDTTSIDGKITACNTGAVVISSGTVTTVSTVTNLSQLGGSAVSMNTGTRDAGTQRVTIATDDVVPASQSGTWNVTNISGTVSLPTGAATAANQSTANSSLSTIAGAVSGTEMQVDVLTMPSTAVTNAGTFAVQAAQSGTWNVTTLTGGSVAHDSADSGNPHKIGAKAESSTSGATLVADGDRTDLYADLDGVLLVRTGRPLGDLLHNRVSNTNGTSTAFSGDFAAAGASIKNYVTGYSIANDSSSDVYVDFRDGTSGTVLWTVPLPANGGANIVSSEPLFGTSANTALAYDVSAATSTVYISVTGFKSKV